MSFWKLLSSFCLVFLLTVLQAFGKHKSDVKTANQLKEIIYFLASDSLEGRRTGSEGERKAGDFIVNFYKLLGVPAYKSEYRLPFSFIYGKEIGETSRIKIGGHVLKIKDEAFPLSFSANGHIAGDVLPDLMEVGSIWIVNLYADQDEANNAHFSVDDTMFQRARYAQKHGATGIIFYDGFGSKWPPTFNGLSVNETIDIPAIFLTNEAYKKFVPSSADTSDSDAAKVRPDIAVDLDITIRKKERTGTNIAAFIDNKAPYTVILGAHYDHLGRGEDGSSRYEGKELLIHHGADDNASGTAALLELAAWVKKQKKMHHYNYLFVHFSGEELGLFGSKDFVKTEKIDSVHFSYMMNMDMVGRLNDSTHSLQVGGIGTSPAWGAIMSKPNKQFKISVDSSGIGPSDHSSFYHEGIPVLFLFTGQHKDYHKPSDEADKINYTGEVEVLKYAEDIIKKMDKNPKPLFTATKQTSLGKVNFKVTLGIMPDYSFQDGGVRVDGVSENKPAKNAGIKEGDIIVRLGDIKVQGMQSYMEALSKFKAGDKTKVTVMRAGKSLELPLEFLK